MQTISNNNNNNTINTINHTNESNILYQFIINVSNIYTLIYIN